MLRGWVFASCPLSASINGARNLLEAFHHDRFERDVVASTHDCFAQVWIFDSIDQSIQDAMQLRPKSITAR
jgi:hypothetical protein